MNNAITTGTTAEVSTRTAQIFRQIEDLKIQSSSGILTTCIPKALHKPSINEALFDACADVKILTSNVSMYLTDAFRKNLFYQIDLIHDSEDWDSDDSPVNKLSFKSFLRWYLLATPEQNPGLGLGSSGNLIAAWIVKKDRLIVEFLPYDKAKWIVATTIEDEVERGSGQTTILRLSEVLSPYHIGKFFQRQE